MRDADEDGYYSFKFYYIYVKVVIHVCFFCYVSQEISTIVFIGC